MPAPKKKPAAKTPVKKFVRKTPAAKSVAQQKREAAEKKRLEKESKFNKVIESIEEGLSLRKSLEVNEMNKGVFYLMCDNDTSKAERYARACVERADVLFEEIIEIADNSGNDSILIDGISVVNHEAIQRDRLRVEARKWAASKLHPTKYGDKIDLNHSGSIEMPLFPDVSKNDGNK